MASSQIFQKPVNALKISDLGMNILKMWCAKQVKDILGYDDDIVSGLIINQINVSRQNRGDKGHVNGAELQSLVTPFFGDKAAPFTSDLYRLLLNASSSPQGVPDVTVLERVKQAQEKLRAEALLQKAAEKHPAVSKPRAWTADIDFNAPLPLTDETSVEASHVLNSPPALESVTEAPLGKTPSTTATQVARRPSPRRNSPRRRSVSPRRHGPRGSARERPHDSPRVDSRGDSRSDDHHRARHGPTGARYDGHHGHSRARYDDRRGGVRAERSRWSPRRSSPTRARSPSPPRRAFSPSRRAASPPRRLALSSRSPPRRIPSPPRQGRSPSPPRRTTSPPRRPRSPSPPRRRSRSPPRRQRSPSPPRHRLSPSLPRRLHASSPPRRHRSSPSPVRDRTYRPTNRDRYSRSPRRWM